MDHPAENTKPSHYLFIIDTNEYAGNFERSMCAYLTGQLDDFEVGKEDAEIAEREIPREVKRLENLVEPFFDGERVRPASTFPNPRYGNNGVGVVALLTEKNKGIYTYPAYNSVAIGFNTLPKGKLLKTLKERAVAFGKRKGIEIEGFRVREEYIMHKERSI